MDMLKRERKQLAQLAAEQLLPGKYQTAQVNQKEVIYRCV